MKTATYPDKIDNLLGMFLLHRGIKFDNACNPIGHLRAYGMRKDPKGRWVVFPMDTVAKFDSGEVTIEADRVIDHATGQVKQDAE